MEEGEFDENGHLTVGRRTYDGEKKGITHIATAGSYIEEGHFDETGSLAIQLYDGKMKPQLISLEKARLYYKTGQSKDAT